MTRVIKCLSPLFVLLLSPLFAGRAEAKTINAASCSQSDVQNSLNSANNGDTVIVPAGTCNWSTPVSTSGKGYVLQGSGAGSTVIIDNVGSSSGQALVISVPPGDSLRITGMTIEPAPGASVYGFISVNGGSTSFRMDNMSFTGWSNNNTSSQPVRLENIFGVIDHCTFSGGFVQFIELLLDSYQGVGSNGDNSWAQPTGFGSGNALFIETNTFTNTYPQGGAQITTDSDGGGGRYVIRYNTFISYGVGHHGTESPGRPRGGRQFEIYNNTFSCDASGGQTCNTTAMIRSGTGLYFNNTLNSVNGSVNPNWNTAASLNIFRISTSLGGWGTCDGTGPWDANDGVVYASGTYTGSNGGTQLVDSNQSWTTNRWFQSGYPYSVRDTTQGWGAEISSNTATTISYIPAIQGYHETTTWNTGDSYQITRAAYCIDQIGRGQSNMLSGNPAIPTGNPKNSVEPIYIFNNNVTNGGIPFGIAGSNSARTIANRDFYLQTSSFNGSSGTGSGLYSEIPSACTPSVAYWATDQNILYKCTATNTWSAFYTPYTYPHPLVSGSGNGNPPAPPTNLTVVVVN